MTKSYIEDKADIITEIQLQRKLYAELMDSKTTLNAYLEADHHTIVRLEERLTEVEDKLIELRKAL